MPLPEPKIRKSGGKRFQRQTEGNFLTGHKLKPLFLRTTWKTDPPRLLQTYDLKMLVMENGRKKTSFLNLTWNGKKRCLQNMFRKNEQLIFCAETFLEIWLIISWDNWLCNFLYLCNVLSLLLLDIVIYSKSWANLPKDILQQRFFVHILDVLTADTFSKREISFYISSLYHYQREIPNYYFQHHPQFGWNWPQQISYQETAAWQQLLIADFLTRKWINWDMCLRR